MKKKSVTVTIHFDINDDSTQYMKTDPVAAMVRELQQRAKATLAADVNVTAIKVDHAIIDPIAALRKTCQS